MINNRHFVKWVGCNVSLKFKRCFCAIIKIIWLYYRKIAIGNTKIWGVDDMQCCTRLLLVPHSVFQTKQEIKRHLPRYFIRDNCFESIHWLWILGSFTFMYMYCNEVCQYAPRFSMKCLIYWNYLKVNYGIIKVVTIRYKLPENETSGDLVLKYS